MAIASLQRQLDRIQPWFRQWKITVNASKTSVILFSSKSSVNNKHITLESKTLQWASSIKYLGVQIDRNLNFSKHVQTVTNKAKGAKHALFYPLINPESPLPNKIKLYIYNTYILPIITYAIPTWYSNTSPSIKHKLETL